MRVNTPAIILIAIGLVLLLDNLGLLNVSLTHLVRVWWPALLIAVGVSMMFKRGK